MENKDLFQPIQYHTRMESLLPSPFSSPTIIKTRKYAYWPFNKNIKKFPFSTSCWRNRTNIERTLIFLIVFLLAIIIFFVVLLLKPNDSDTPTVCMASDCIMASAEILNFIDKTTDPCDDFYQFTCGKFLKEVEIPDDKNTVRSESHMEATLQKQMKEALEKPITKTEIKPFIIVKTVYNACMNKSLIEKEGLKPVKRIFQNLGGWPVLEGSTWNERDFDWKQLIYNMKHLGLEYESLIAIAIGADLKNSTKRVLTIGAPEVPFSRRILIQGLNNEIVAAYYEYMVDIAVIFGANKSAAQRELKAVLEFEIKLANISSLIEELRNLDAMNNLVNITTLQEMYTYMPWLSYFNMLLSPYATLNESFVIRNSVPEYFKSLEEVLKRTPKRVIANYIFWKALMPVLDYLKEDVQKRSFQYATVLSGNKEIEPRWKLCLKSVSNLRIISAALYVQNYFDRELKEKASLMVDDIQKSFIDILQKNDWIDDDTKKKAIAKAEVIEKHIAFPDELFDDHKLTEYTKDLVVDPEKYLLSMLNISLFLNNDAIKMLEEPVNKSDWKTHSSSDVINAFYRQAENSIILTAAKLQNLYFGKHLPNYINYGNIGAAIGHEITHGFDNFGRNFDKDGNLQDWWSFEMEHTYLNKVKCFINQYSNITVPEINMKINGTLTLNENIADNGGFKTAYKAYKKLVQKRGSEELLPGLNYSQKQLFWISLGISWCQKIRPESQKVSFLKNDHAPAKYRVNVAAQNSKSFAKAFGCDVGTKMNPLEKCELW